MKTTYTSYTMSIGPYAYKDIVPERMAVENETEDKVVGTRFWGLFKTWETVETGRTLIIFSFKKHPGATMETDEIPFDTRDEAVAWYNYIYQRIFLNKEDAKFAAPPPKPKGPNLRLV